MYPFSTSGTPDVASAKAVWIAQEAQAYGTQRALRQRR